MTVTPWGCFYNGKPPTNGDTVPKISFFARNNTNQSIPSGFWTKLNLTAINHELPVGQVDLVNDRWVCPFDGHYSLTTSIQMDVYWTQTDSAIDFRKNGVRQCITTNADNSIDQHALPLSTSDQMVAGDYWEVWIWHNSFSSANLLSATCNQAQFTGWVNYLL